MRSQATASDLFKKLSLYPGIGQPTSLHSGTSRLCVRNVCVRNRLWNGTYSKACWKPQGCLHSLCWALEPAQGAKCLQCGQGLTGGQTSDKHNHKPKLSYITFSAWQGATSTVLVFQKLTRESKSPVLWLFAMWRQNKDKWPSSATLNPSVGVPSHVVLSDLFTSSSQTKVFLKFYVWACYFCFSLLLYMTKDFWMCISLTVWIVIDFSIHILYSSFKLFSHFICISCLTGSQKSASMRAMNLCRFFLHWTPKSKSKLHINSIRQAVKSMSK